jgi:hypothetical protein
MWSSRTTGEASATGWADFPNRPSWPGSNTFRGYLIHSSEYRFAHTSRLVDLIEDMLAQRALLFKTARLWP